MNLRIVYGFQHVFKVIAFEKLTKIALPFYSATFVLHADLFWSRNCLIIGLQKDQKDETHRSLWKFYIFGERNVLFKSYKWISKLFVCEDFQLHPHTHCKIIILQNNLPMHKNKRSYLEKNYVQRFVVF